MKIIHSLEGTSWSGGQQQALFLAHEQQKAGHEILLICQKGSVLEQKGREAGLRLWPNNYAKEMNPFSIFNLLKAYDSFRPDVVNVHRAWAHTQWIVVSLLRRFKGLIVTRRVLFKPDANPVSLVKYRTPVVKGYIAVSEAVAERLQQTGVSRKRIKVVYSATDTGRFSPDLHHQLAGPWPDCENADSRPTQPVALMVGNFSRNKGHQVLVEAFKKMSDQWPELHLAVAGSDTDCQPLRDIVAGSTAEKRLHLLGFRTDVPAMMQRSVFTVNASFQEGFSGTVRESLVMGVPVIASSIPANVEVSNIVPLQLFSAGDSDSLAAQMLKFKNQPVGDSFRNDLRRQSVKAFSLDTMVNGTLAAYRDFLGN